MKKNKYMVGGLVLAAALAHPTAVLADTEVVAKPQDQSSEATAKKIEDTKKELLAAQTRKEKAEKTVDTLTTERQDAFDKAFAAEKEASEHMLAVETAMSETATATTELETTTTQIEPAQAELETAQTELDKVESANQELTAQINEQEKAVTTAESNVNAAANAQKLAESTLAGLENNANASDITTAQAEKTQAETDLYNKNADLQKASYALSEAENTLAAKSAELQATIAKLQDAANATDNKVTEIKNVTEVKTQSGNKYMEGYAKFANNKGLEPTIYADGERTEYIELNDQQKQEYAAKNYFRYTPNVDKINQYVIDYINELRAQHGLVPVVSTPTAMQWAEARTNEQISHGEVSHYTELNFDRTWENIAILSYKTLYRYDSTILSDKQAAYVILNEFFSEYRNDISHNYGHRHNLLFGQGEFGVGVKDVKSKYGVQLLQLTMLGVNSQVRDSNATAERFVTQKINEQGIVEYRYKGQPVKFLPNVKFVYTITDTKTVTSDDKEQATAKLNEAKATASATLANLQNKVATAKATKDAALEAKNKAETRLNAAIAKVELISAANQSTFVAIQEAKATLAEKTAALETAKANLATEQAKLNELVAQSSPLAAARKAVETASAKVDELKAKKAALEAVIAQHTSLLATAQARQTELDAIKQSTRDTFTKRDKELTDAKKDLSAAQEVYTGLKDEYDRLLALFGQKTGPVIAELPDGKTITLPSVTKPAFVKDKLTLTPERAEQTLVTPANKRPVSEGAAVPVETSGLSALSSRVTRVQPASLSSGQRRVAQAATHVSQAPEQTLPATGTNASPLALVGCLGLASLALACLETRRKAKA